MKETLNVNIGGVAFTIDEDACRTLKSYLKKIEVRLPYDDKETLQDIERRVAELLCEKITSPQRVVTMAEVKEAMATLGEPDTFGTSQPPRVKLIVVSTARAQIVRLQVSAADWPSTSRWMPRCFASPPSFLSSSAVCRFGSMYCCGLSFPKNPDEPLISVKL